MAGKRRTLGLDDTALGTAVKAKNNEVAPTESKYSASAVNLRMSDWDLLRRVAWARTGAKGSGRPSMSKVIESLIKENRDRLQKEIE